MGPQVMLQEEVVQELGKARPKLLPLYIYYVNQQVGRTKQVEPEGRLAGFGKLLAA
jgi:hypothetical protein